jgi:hypothetical protein
MTMTRRRRRKRRKRTSERRGETDAGIERHT